MDPSTGAIHAVGTYDHSSLLNLVPGPFGLVSTNGGTDAFLVKLNAGNNVSWARRIGGSSNDAGNGVCIGPNGNIYVTGSFKGSMSETLISAVLSTLTSTNGSQDIFVACYTPTGELLWMEKAGGTDNETGFSIAANSSGVFVHGQFRGPAQFGSITVSPPTTGKDHLFVAKYPLTGGDPEWVRQGVNSKDNTAGKITADEDGAYVTGTFKENFLSWRTPANGVLSTVNCANNSQNIHITSFSNSGDINWMKAINESGSESASNAIAVTCGRVIISGRVHTGSSIPGLGILSHAGAHDVLFIASFDKSTGNGQWVRTALGDSDHLNEGLDLCVGTSGQILLSGTFEEWLTWDNGQNFTGDGGQEMFIASFSPWGDLIWWRAETADSHEWPYAIATDDQGRIIVGGRYEQSISLPPFSASSNSNDNIFLASRIGSLTWANDPSKWDHPGTLCSNTGQIDLNTRLRGTGRKVLSSTSMTDPALSLGLPDGAGSAFNAAGSSITIDLGDTLESGSAYRITWRLASSGLGKMAIEYSSDGSNWTSHSSIQQNSSLTYSDAELTSPVAFRYIRLTRPTSVTSANFLMDGITTRINTLYGGAWSGEQITSSGILDLSGLNGTYAYTYTITSDACTWSTTRQLHIMVPGSSGIITGSSSVCPGTSPGPLTLTGNTGQIIRWERSIDGFVSILPINSTAVSITPGNLTVTTQWRVLLDQGACGMIHSAVHTVTVADTVAPAIICPADITVAAGAGCTATVQFAVPTAIDNCGGTVSMTRIAGPANNSAFPIGSTMITYKAVDASENTATCSFTVNVIDDSPPVIMSAPAGPLVLDLGDDCEVLMPDLRNQLNVSDCSPMSLVQTPAPGTFISSSDDLTITVSAAGGTTSWSTPIDVIDATPPTMTCPGGLTIQLPPGDSTMAVNYAEPGVADNCGPVTLTHVGPFPVSGGQFHAGSTILEFQAEDAAGNTATCSFEIVLVPNDVPQISCPANIQVTTALGLCEQLVAYPVPVASDNQDGTLTPALVQGDPPGNFSVGDHPISYTVTDLDGNSASCTFIVEVMDEEAPVLACPDTTTISSSAGCTALVPDLTSTLIAGDNCGGAISIVQIPAAGSVRSIGSHSITFHVSDASGNTAQCTSILTIIDDTAPVIICPPDTVLNADANSCGTTHDATVVATDACIFLTVWNDHPDQWFEVGTSTVTAFASDAADNTVNCSFQVTVVDVTIPDLECPEDLTQIPTDPGECTSLVQFSAIADDACGGVDLTFSHHTNDLPVHAFPVGLTTVSVDAIDAHGLSNSCQFTVEVIDLQVPEIQCPASIVNTVMPGECGANITFDATANDNCGIASINYSHPPGGYFTIGDHVIDCIATDLSGNVTTCSFNISIMDLDSDGDGTGDCTDQCPDDPLKTLAGDCGCDQPEPGTSCDDNDANTVNDMIGTDCACTGEPVDCAGIANGSAYFDNCGSCVGGTTNIDPCTQDCAGTWGGSAYFDNCGSCVGGTTNLDPCTQDCAEPGADRRTSTTAEAASAGQRTSIHARRIALEPGADRRSLDLLAMTVTHARSTTLLDRTASAQGHHQRQMPCSITRLRNSARTGPIQHLTLPL